MSLIKNIFNIVFIVIGYFSVALNVYADDIKLLGFAEAQEACQANNFGFECAACLNVPTYADKNSAKCQEYMHLLEVESGAKQNASDREAGKQGNENVLMTAEAAEKEMMRSGFPNYKKHKYISPSCAVKAYVENRKSMPPGKAISKLNQDCFSKSRLAAYEYPRCIGRHKTKVEDAENFCQCQVEFIVDYAEKTLDTNKLSPDCVKKFGWGNISSETARERKMDRDSKAYFPSGINEAFQQYLEVDY